ncbi:hypothetical protein MTP99_008828 [Tenebrio molitor]|jgi:hypothetical protein|nr:hypothetical protein MTP99_008828 [Tenebrio molitor]
MKSSRVRQNGNRSRFRCRSDGSPGIKHWKSDRKSDRVMRGRCLKTRQSTASFGTWSSSTINSVSESKPETIPAAIRIDSSTDFRKVRSKLGAFVSGTAQIRSYNEMSIVPVETRKDFHRMGELSD